jgi:hypothetical protein
LGLHCSDQPFGGVPVVPGIGVGILTGGPAGGGTTITGAEPQHPHGAGMYDPLQPYPLP